MEREKQQLKQMVQTLLERIEENQRIQQHFRQFEFQLLSCVRLGDLLKLLFEIMPSHFRLQDVGVILVDRDYATRDLIKLRQLSTYKNRLQLRYNTDFALTLYGNRRQVVLGDLDALTASRLFPNSSNIGSVALLPLWRQEQLIGSVHFATEDATRFSADKSTDFMAHLASIMAVCLENCLVHEHLRLQSQIDQLTKVRNRHSFDDEFKRELERARRHQEALACMFVDVDHFKTINDQHGHQAGDLCLREIAASIQGELRKTDLLARYGGEEFVVLLPRCNLETAKLIAERVREAVACQRIDLMDNTELNPTVSVGVSCWAPGKDSNGTLAHYGEQLLRLADTAMYQAKSQGRNQVVVKPFYQVVQGAD